MKYLVILPFLVLLSCKKPNEANSDASIEHSTVEVAPRVEEELDFSDLVWASLMEDNLNILLDVTLRSGEKRKVELPHGASSLGYYIDQQFNRVEAGGFVRFRGSDGSESGASYGAMMTVADSSKAVEYTIINTGKQKRRVLIYTR